MVMELLMHRQKYDKQSGRRLRNQLENLQKQGVVGSDKEVEPELTFCWFCFFIKLV